MASQPLHAPWRMHYIRSLDQGPAPGECFLCAAAACPPGQYEQRLVLWTTPHSLVLLNAFPYTNGHLLVAPRVHEADLEVLSPEALLDLQVQAIAAVRLLKRAMSPQGFNLGINLGRPAGAGLPGHVHQHVVPRWNGDTNFMTVLGDVRVIPQAIEVTWRELAETAREMKLTHA